MRIVSPGFDPNSTTFLCRLALVSELTPSLPQPVKFPWLKSAHTYTPANSIFASPVANLLSILCIWAEILSRAHAKGGLGGGEGGGEGESLNYFKFCTFGGRSPIDGAADMAVKGLSRRLHRGSKACRNRCHISQKILR